MVLYIIAAEMLERFINFIRSKGIEIGDHEIKTVNFTDQTTIFLTPVTCLNGIKII